MKFLVNIYKTSCGKIVTICDIELYGSVLRDGEIIYEISEFYYGKEFKKEDIDPSLFDEASCIHVIGKNSLRLLRELNVIREEDLKFVRYIQGIPVLIVFNVQKILR